MDIKEESTKFASVYKDLAEIVGTENTKKIHQCFKGQEVTFPQRLYSKEYVTSYIKEHYDGKNLKELSKEFGYAERSIRRILQQEKEKGYERKR